MSTKYKIVRISKIAVGVGFIQNLPEGQYSEKICETLFDTGNDKEDAANSENYARLICDALNGYQLAIHGREEGKWENEAKEAWRKIEIYKGEADRYKKEYQFGREELEKENSYLKEMWEANRTAANENSKTITALQSQCTEKEEVNRGLQNTCKKWETICEELKAENEAKQEIIKRLDNRCFSMQTSIENLSAENERLKGLIKDEFIGVMKTVGGIDEEESEKMWQQFKSENNL